MENKQANDLPCTAIYIVAINERAGKADLIPAQILGKTSDFKHKLP